MTQATLRRMRWWDIDPLLPLEHDLFGDESWSAVAFWSELAQSSTRHYVVAEDGDELVGWAGLAAWTGEAFVQTIAVRRDRQRGGIGRALLSELLEEAGRRGERHVMLEVRANDERAQRMYARAGFEPIGRRPRYYQPSGVDAVVMRAELS
ncbi:MAG: [ribosomal protein S18]-alanine N-acetyltransferase [Frankiaceae bacterium]|jgi:ribosomal-protein-alanine N-acetyltransferase|nr:[ribosomal protein S18]-alanine N-acetyltransferase [Frankiaceae bacterium]MDQ1726554.1 [ribosomal protein S18]-alanine N-acetyltransferase [Frankiaceae bacterium]